MLMQEAQEAARKLADFKPTVMPRLLAEDATPEQLAVLMSDQGGRMAIFSAEGTVFELMAGRYSQNGGSNIELFLQSFKGETVRVDRKGRPELLLLDPALTICLAIQPDVIESMSRKPGMSGRGLLGRFLYEMPESLLGLRRIGAADVDEGTRLRYSRMVERLLNLEAQATTPILRFSLDAQSIFQEFESWLEPRLGPFGELGSMSDWGGKLAGAAARIAGILHVLERIDQPNLLGGEIGPETVMHALGVAEFCIPHARATYADMQADPQMAAAQHLLDWIQKEQCKEFKRRELHQAVRGRYPKAEMLEGPIRTLTTHGYIKIFEVPEKKKRGRPSEKYLVNPELLNFEDSEDMRMRARSKKKEG
jgi:hypothetical protein